jgi:hypothetical protein
MVGKEVLIVLRDLETNKLIPTRWARIVLAERIGRVYYFEYILGALIQYSEDETERMEQIAERTTVFEHYHSWLPGTVGQSLNTAEPSVFASSAAANFPTTDDSIPSEWGNTTAAVTTARIFENTEFLNVLGLQDLAGNEVPVENECFIVRSNTVYQLRVLQTIPRPDVANLRPHDVELVTFSDHFVQLRPKQRAVGKYDVLNFVLKTKRLPPNERSAIEIPYVPLQSQSASAPSGIYMPIRIEARSRASVIIWLTAVIACLVVMFRPELLPLDPPLVRNISTVVFVLLVTGWQQTAGALIPSLPWAAGKP